jgi:Mg2+/Co2+ transporter CorB
VDGSTPAQRLTVLTSPQSKMELLANQFLYFKQFKTADAHVPGQQSVSAAIIAVIKMHLMVVNANGSLAVKTVAVNNPQKLKTALSVPQLALFIRLITAMKIIDEDNTTGFLKLVASAVATNKTGNVSSESLRNNFYSPNIAAKEVMKDYLFGMLNLLKSF